ncbi:MAG: adenine deaminase [Ignavibacteria bacterium]|nr:adenine deaminase [Ignavibacteria bacterium]
MPGSGRLQGKIVDLHNRCTFNGTVEWVDGIITSIIETHDNTAAAWIMPGFIDAHVHVESSMLPPSEFARIAVTHGTVCTVSDPHEIANVCGIDGVRYMIDDGARTPFKFAFGAPSCVPATSFETAGAEITAAEIRELFRDERIRYLSEMMNWPGVLMKDSAVCQKIEIAHACGRVVDGHAPGLRGEKARAYAELGITTDHECTSLEEALDKVACGMNILIREGSAARNFEALHALLSLCPESVMLCCDDIHPDELVLGHINRLVARALALGYDIYDVLRAACVAPVRHYKLPVGTLQVGDPADFIVVDDIATMHVQETWIDGVSVAKDGRATWEYSPASEINNFGIHEIPIEELADVNTGKRVRAIVAHDGELVTTDEVVDIDDATVLKIIVVNRYRKAPISKAYIKNLGLVDGAFASTVAHDSHNIVAAGTNDVDLVDAINAVIRSRGGISVAHAGDIGVLPLQIAGLMSAEPADVVANLYTELDARVKNLGSKLRAPFMTLSFMALLVIPSLKLSDKGLFDGTTFRFTDVHV